MKINTDPMNMDALDFYGDMWDPEYCDSELRAVEASGESLDELCLYWQTQLKLNHRLTGGNFTRVTIAWQWPSDAMDKKCCWDYPSIMLRDFQTWLIMQVMVTRGAACQFISELPVCPAFTVYTSQAAKQDN